MRCLKLNFLKRNVFVFMLLLIIAVATGCGPKSFSESEIKDKVQSIIGKEYKIDEFEVDRRKTEKDSGKDTVWVTFQYSNDYVDVDSEMILYYELFNDGWEYVDNEEERKFITPLASSATKEDALEELRQNGYENVTYKGREDDPLEKGVDRLDFEYKEYYGLLVQTFEVYVYYQFDDLKWRYDKISTYKTHETIDGIIGKWSYTDDKGNEFYLNITKFDMEEETIELEYNFKHGKRHEKSKRIEAYDLDGLFLYEVGDIISVSIPDLHADIFIYPTQKDADIEEKRQSVKDIVGKEQGINIDVYEGDFWLNKE